MSSSELGAIFPSTLAHDMTRGGDPFVPVEQIVLESAGQIALTYLVVA